jgi:ankyrin repeat protein
VEFGCPETVRYLVQAKGFSVDSKFESGRTALQVASEGVCLETVSVLLHLGAETHV